MCEIQSGQPGSAVCGWLVDTVILHFPVSHLDQIFASKHLTGTLDLTLKSIFVKTVSSFDVRHHYLIYQFYKIRF